MTSVCPSNIVADKIGIIRLDVTNTLTDLYYFYLDAIPPIWVIFSSNGTKFHWTALMYYCQNSSELFHTRITTKLSQQWNGTSLHRKLVAAISSGKLFGKKALSMASAAQVYVTTYSHRQWHEHQMYTFYISKFTHTHAHTCRFLSGYEEADRTSQLVDLRNFSQPRNTTLLHEFYLATTQILEYTPTQRLSTRTCTLMTEQGFS